MSGALASELRRSAIVKAVDNANECVVNIHGQKTLTTADDPTIRSDSPKRVNGMGTGVIIDQRGYILTNHHVVDGVKKIEVSLADKSQHIARFIASNAAEDLAIIKLDDNRVFQVLKVGTSKDLRKGEEVIAIGNAFGYEHTVTRGIVSQLNRSVQISDTQSYDELIQTDASINPGNSGGPLMNIDGDLIGINVAVRQGASGIGFAIPVDKAMKVAAELMSVERLENRWHGLTTSITADGSGVIVDAVAKNSPAEKMGIQVGDKITKIDNLAIERQLDVERAFLGQKLTTEIPVSVVRQNQPQNFVLALATAPKNADENDPYWQMLGLKFSAIPSQQFKQIHTHYRGGLTITSVRGNSPAAKQGLKKGDILVGLHIWETISLENVDYILSQQDLKEIAPLKFRILRDEAEYFGYLPITIKR